MATKTISVDLEAYEALRRARWETKAKTCGDLLLSLPGMPRAEDEVLDRLERAQAQDETPDNPWA